MDKRRTCENCWSADHHLEDCFLYTQEMKSLGYDHDSDEMKQMHEIDFNSGLFTKIGARFFFCSQESHFRIE